MPNRRRLALCRYRRTPRSDPRRSGGPGASASHGSAAEGEGARNLRAGALGLRRSWHALAIPGIHCDVRSGSKRRIGKRLGYPFRGFGRSVCTDPPILDLLKNKALTPTLSPELDLYSVTAYIFKNTPRQGVIMRRKNGADQTDKVLATGRAPIHRHLNGGDAA